jgi:hypothetical protein
MTWTKQIDRSKFPLSAWVMCSWHPKARKWFCALFPNTGTDDDPLACGEGDNPFEAMLSMCISLGALSESGVWGR